MQETREENPKMCQKDIAGAGWEKQPPGKFVWGPGAEEHPAGGRSPPSRGQELGESQPSVRGWVAEFHPIPSHSIPRETGTEARVLSTESCKPRPSLNSNSFVVVMFSSGKLLTHPQEEGSQAAMSVPRGSLLPSPTAD